MELNEAGAEGRKQLLSFIFELQLNNNNKKMTSSIFVWLVWLFLSVFLYVVREKTGWSSLFMKKEKYTHMYTK